MLLKIISDCITVLVPTDTATVVSQTPACTAVVTV